MKEFLGIFQKFKYIFEHVNKVQLFKPKEE